MMDKEGVAGTCVEKGKFRSMSVVNLCMDMDLILCSSDFCYPQQATGCDLPFHRWQYVNKNKITDSLSLVTIAGPVGLI